MAWAADERQQLIEHLTTLSEYYDKRVSDKALTFWSEQLKGYTPWAVLSVLDDWAKTDGKFPVLKDVILRANERVSRRLEEQAKRDNASTPAASKVVPRDPTIVEAQRRFFEAVHSLPSAPRDYWDKHAALCLASGRKIRDRFDGSMRELSTIKRLYLEQKYGEHPSQEFLDAAKAEVNAHIAARKACPTFKQILAQVRAEAAACIA